MCWTSYEPTVVWRGIPNQFLGYIIQNPYLIWANFWPKSNWTRLNLNYIPRRLLRRSNHSCDDMYHFMITNYSEYNWRIR